MSKKILIVYYSHSANTRKLAKLIEQETGGTLCELLPEKAYPVDYNTVVEQAKKEIQAGFRPDLKTKVKDIASYNTVLIGTPNWWSTIAPPIATFLESYDLSGKNVAPFCTHGGGGSGHIEATVKKLCPDSTVLSALSVYGDTAKGAQVESWLKKIGVK
ncbi:flavodoxin signature [Lucifera butyrica]|uniref:Flavodoxin signature n=1 Tax=Lucifera butyrica TaxID=1351585 RepID=A0A498R0S0_9FIRM|nr:flavodoxin [Lucifera butyrica]VBB04911.1 flavodoxin signature [Lucifera butyrica]